MTQPSRVVFDGCLEVASVDSAARLRLRPLDNLGADQLAVVVKNRIKRIDLGKRPDRTEPVVTGLKIEVRVTLQADVRLQEHELLTVDLISSGVTLLVGGGAMLAGATGAYQRRRRRVSSDRVH
jgi:hypothetical protein